MSQHDQDSMAIKKERLIRALKGIKSLAVGFSGGVDSTVLLAVSKQVLGDRVVAMTAISPVHPKREFDHAVQTAESLGVQHILFETDEMSDPMFTSNGSDRCYHCKRRLFKAMRVRADEAAIETIAHGANIDDLSDFRPGFKAAEELEVVAPLVDAGFTKNDIRKLARQLGLSNWDRPAMACLATRVPYGTTIDDAILDKIDRAEMLLLKTGIASCRVRHHGNLARIEIDMAQMEPLINKDMRARVIDGLRALGYKFVCLDLEGYESGKMNREL